MRFSLVALLVSSLAWADGPDAGTDVPRQFDENDVRLVKKGDLVPFDGLEYSDRAAIATEGGLRKCEADRDNAQSDLSARPTNTQIYIAAAILVVGAFFGGYYTATTLNHR